MKKFTKKQKQYLQLVYNSALSSRNIYWEAISKIELDAFKKLGIEIEVFHVNGEPVGIGDYSRKYELLHFEGR